MQPFIHRWLAILLLPFVVSTGWADPPLAPEVRTQAEEARQRASQFLLVAQQSDGGWIGFGKTDLGITAVVAKALAVTPGIGPNHASVKRGIEFIRTFVQPNGGIYVEADGFQNYQTSVALMALHSAGDPADRDRIVAAQKFLTTLQWDEPEDHPPSSVWYGGAGYGKSKRPDLSNTQMMIEALKESGLSSDDPAYKKAVDFISRCQMSSHSNDQPFAHGGGDGGFIYSPANGGESKAGEETLEGRPRLRSYGSMTYAAFKSLLYAGLTHDDPRVQQAWEWIRRHYTLDENPNMPGAQSKEGLYYFYHVFAKALDAWGQEEVVDLRGVKHPWREDLYRKLIELQRSDGSWSNEADRWYEGNPYLVTGYSLLALDAAMGD